MVPADPRLQTLIDAATVFAVPLRDRFRGLTTRTGIVLQGPAGWGEFAPFEEYGPEEAARWLDAAVEAAFLGVPQPVRETVGVNAIIPAVTPERAAALAEAAATERGCRTAKVKVAEPGGSLASDADRVAAVAETFRGRIKVDANGAWQPDEACAALAVLERVAGGLEYAEQPCPDLVGLAEVRRRIGVPIAADESIRRSSDPVAAARAAAADVIVVKPTPLGGVRRALDVVAEAGIPTVASCALDTSVGLAQTLAFAAALPELDHDCGLGTGALLAADLVSEPLFPDDGVMRTDYRARCDDELLAQATARVSEPERERWLQRLSQAWTAGTRARLGRLLADSDL